MNKTKEIVDGILFCLIFLMIFAIGNLGNAMIERIK